MQSDGLSPKTINNRLNFLHGLFNFAIRRGWAHANPVAAIECPRAGDTDPDVQFLDRDEIEALMAAVPDDSLGNVERPLYVTATMCGLRQGELLALRWLDVDWKARVIRVRRNYTRGRFGKPKSRRSTRSVPMPRRVAAEIRRHHRGSKYTGDTDLVFCHPDTGSPYDASKMRKRFKEAVAAARIRPIRFHEYADVGTITTCATPSARGWPAPVRRCGSIRSGWVTATTRRPRSTPTSPPTLRRRPAGRRPPSARRAKTRKMRFQTIAIRSRHPRLASDRHPSVIRWSASN